MTMLRATRIGRHAVRRSVNRLRRASRYDLVLAVIPAAFVLAAMAGASSSVSARTTVAAAAIVGGLAMIDALFLHPPQRPSAARARRRIISGTNEIGYKTDHTCRSVSNTE